MYQRIELTGGGGPGMTSLQWHVPAAPGCLSPTLSPVLHLVP